VEFLWPTRPDGNYGERLKVTHADIDAWSREKERKSSRPHGDIQPKITF
jgi:hypothetical protein